MEEIILKNINQEYKKTKTRYIRGTDIPLKRLICDIPLSLHQEIMVLACRRGITMTKYIQQIFMEEIKRELVSYDE